MVPEPARPNIPTPSTQSFFTPTATVKSGPSIKNLIHDPVSPAPAPIDIAVQPQEQTAPTVALPASEPLDSALKTVPEAVTIAPPSASEPSAKETVADESAATDASVPAAEKVPVQTVKCPPADPDEDPEAFQTFWETLVETLFADLPTLHEPLKHYHPVRKENILIIPVKNDIQENAFAPRKHQVLKYLRDNWDETVDDIEVKLDINMETKKFILDDNDKLNALREQNPDIADFIKSLNLRIKN